MARSRRRRLVLWPGLASSRFKGVPVCAYPSEARRVGGRADQHSIVAQIIDDACGELTGLYLHAEEEAGAANVADHGSVGRCWFRTPRRFLTRSRVFLGALGICCAGRATSMRWSTRVAARLESSMGSYFGPCCVLTEASEEGQFMLRRGESWKRRHCVHQGRAAEDSAAVAIPAVGQLMTRRAGDGAVDRDFRAVATH